MARLLPSMMNLISPTQGKITIDGLDSVKDSNRKGIRFYSIFFMTVSLMIAGISTKIGAPMVGSMTVLICYVLGFLSRLLGDKAQWISKLSPFEMFSPENAIALEKHTIYAVIIYFVISVCFVIVGGIMYKHRDFNI